MKLKSHRYRTGSAAEHSRGEKGIAGLHKVHPKGRLTAKMLGAERANMALARAVYKQEHASAKSIQAMQKQTVSTLRQNLRSLKQQPKANANEATLVRQEMAEINAAIASTSSSSSSSSSKKYGYQSLRMKPLQTTGWRRIEEYQTTGWKRNVVLQTAGKTSDHELYGIHHKSPRGFKRQRVRIYVAPSPATNMKRRMALKKPTVSSIGLGKWHLEHKSYKSKK